MFIFNLVCFDTVIDNKSATFIVQYFCCVTRHSLSISSKYILSYFCCSNIRQKSITVPYLILMFEKQCPSPLGTWMKGWLTFLMLNVLSMLFDVHTIIINFFRQVRFVEGAEYVDDDGTRIQTTVWTVSQPRENGQGRNALSHTVTYSQNMLSNNKKANKKKRKKVFWATYLFLYLCMYYISEMSTWDNSSLQSAKKILTTCQHHYEAQFWHRIPL